MHFSRTIMHDGEGEDSCCIVVLRPRLTSKAMLGR